MIGGAGLAVEARSTGSAPNTLVTAIITEKGIARNPYGEIFQAWFA